MPFYVINDVIFCTPPLFGFVCVRDVVLCQLCGLDGRRGRGTQLVQSISFLSRRDLGSGYPPPPPPPLLTLTLRHTHPAKIGKCTDESTSQVHIAAETKSYLSFG